MIIAHFCKLCRSFEKEFSNGLQSLGPMLNNTCEAEPYLTHLAQSILGDAGDN